VSQFVYSPNIPKNCCHGLWLKLKKLVVSLYQLASTRYI